MAVSVIAANCACSVRSVHVISQLLVGVVSQDGLWFVSTEGMRVFVGFHTFFLD